jgi:hypothetical protein
MESSFLFHCNWTTIQLCDKNNINGP